jgi:hypothetical protein
MLHQVGPADHLDHSSIVISFLSEFFVDPETSVYQIHSIQTIWAIHRASATALQAPRLIS